MAASPKPEPVEQITTYAAANACLRDLGLAQRRQQELTLRAQAQIDKIKDQLTKDLEPWAAKDRRCTEALKKFLHANKKDFRQDRRTVDLTFGKIGFRTPPATLRLSRGFSEADVVELFKRAHPKEWASYVQVRESLRRDEIKFAFSIDELEKLGLSLDQKEQPVIEPRLDVEPNDKEAA